MPGKARKKSERGIYHIIMRGVNRQSIFEDKEDVEKFIQTIGQYKEKTGYEVYAAVMFIGITDYKSKVYEGTPIDVYHILLYHRS
ncbi:MAG: hypothetical protein ACOYVK_15350 [Bacillota bacterium]